MFQISKGGETGEELQDQTQKQTQFGWQHRLSVRSPYGCVLSITYWGGNVATAEPLGLGHPCLLCPGPHPVTPCKSLQQTSQQQFPWRKDFTEQTILIFCQSFSLFLSLSVSPHWRLHSFSLWPWGGERKDSTELTSQNWAQHSFVSGSPFPNRKHHMEEDLGL